MKLNDHSSRAHAVLSASSSARWLKCPPSAAAALMYENAETEFTREGTLAHEVAEIVTKFRGGFEYSENLLADVKNWTASDEVTPEMVRCALGYADYIQELITDENAVVLLEQRLNFSPWVPDGFGTGDCVIIQGNRLDVVDYKYGQGVAVSAVENSQMRLYGLGALNDFGDIYDIHEVAVHIYQPRMNNISVEAMVISDLLAWGEAIKPTAALAAEGKGEFSPGAHCRFCPHSGACPSLAAACMRVVNTSGGKAAVPTLLPWQVAEVLKVESMISGWLKAVKDRALSQLMNGEAIPGFKVVEGRGSRAWDDTGYVAEVLLRNGCASEDIYSAPELLSPAQMEKSLGKKRVAELVGSLIVSKPGSPTVAPESDKRKPFDRLAEARKDFE